MGIILLICGSTRGESQPRRQNNRETQNRQSGRIPLLWFECHQAQREPPERLHSRACWRYPTGTKRTGSVSAFPGPLELDCFKEAAGVGMAVHPVCPSIPTTAGHTVGDSSNMVCDGPRGMPKQGIVLVLRKSTIIRTNCCR